MSVNELVKQGFLSAVVEEFGFSLSDVPMEIPPRIELGDIASPIAFDLAKRLKAETGEKQNPRDLARRLADRLGQLSGITRVEVAGAGYVNVFYDRASYLKKAVAGSFEPTPQINGKIIVEHTSINPNKAAHIGHLRNAVLGDTIVRMLRAAGEQVEVQNYIDNTGVQVADVVVGFRHLEEKTLEQVSAIDARFDYYCWDLYSRVGAFYEEDRTRLALRETTLHEIEAGSGEICEMADYISTRVLHCHLETMRRIDVRYDLLPRESEVLHLHLWNKTFDLLKERGAIEYATEGKLAGCWVMRAEDREEGEAGEYEADKVIVRSNGTVTYTGKDIAIHLWKLGQLELDFFYKPFHTYPDGHVAWITTASEDENHSGHPRFGSGAAYFNVIDIGQSYPQHYVKLGVMAVDPDERARRSAHLAYEKVVLTPAAAEQLGQHLAEGDRKRGVVAMSGRKGLGVKADDLLDQLERNALAEVAGRHPDLSDEAKAVTARQIAVGALRYMLLKYSRNSIIAFDFKDALAFDGETGPYIQYSVVRANSIFRKLEAAGFGSTATLDEQSMDRINELLSGDEGNELWGLAYQAARLADVLDSAIGALEPAMLAKWTFQLAQRFNLFYHHHHILSEEDPARRALLTAITALVRRQLTTALGLLGVEPPERM